VADRPIIFSAPMIRALLDGRKTQTRRLAWGDLIAEPANKTYVHRHEGSLQGWSRPSSWRGVKPGDNLWVRETFWGCDFRETGELPIVVYAERHHGKSYDHPGNVMIAAPRFGHISAIHMPKKASRLTLTVTATRVERLQEISEDDAVAEGCHRVREWLASAMFRELWDALHGAGAWAANPEIVALAFSVARENIDAKEAT